MSTRLPWTKLQDFYLRLGFLKVLAATLSPERRSATNDSIVRRIERPLFDGIEPRSPLAEVAELLQRAATKHHSGSTQAAGGMEVVEALVADPAVGSALYAVTRDTAYKVLDWGRDVDFIGRANQISERALLLQSFLPRDRTERFLAGDPTTWNPFALSLQERLFFLFHLVEHDLVTVQLIDDLAELAPDTVIEARRAEQMMCAALFRMLETTEKLHDAASVREHRTALELALTMADEVDAPIPPRWSRQSARVRLARETKAAMRRPIRPSNKSSVARKTTKNADHQTIPRFEQLVDLGFLHKPGADSDDAAASLGARRRWRYVPSETCRRWARAYRSRGAGDVDQLKRSLFAAVAMEAFMVPSVSPTQEPTVEEVARRLWAAYASVGRAVGLSPVDSIALRAMIDAAADGIALEMESIHRLLLIIKQKAVLTDCVLFAAGSTLDTMFVRLKPTFLERLPIVVSDIAEEWTR